MHAKTFQKRIRSPININRLSGFFVILLCFSWTLNSSSSKLVTTLNGAIPEKIPSPLEQPTYSVSSTTVVSDNVPEIPEQRQLTMKWPRKIRLGDSGIIRVSLECIPANTLSSSTVEVSSLGKATSIQHPNLYETYNVFGDARLEISGFEIETPTEIVESMRPGKPIYFSWNLKPYGPGIVEGMIWLHLRLIPISGGFERRLPITAQFVEIETPSFLGLSGREARGLGFLGVMTGLFLVFDSIPAGKRKFLGTQI